MKPGGTFLIYNESNGETSKDNRWTNIIEGMTIYNAEQIKAVLLDAGFTNIKAKRNDRDWLCVLAEKDQ